MPIRLRKLIGGIALVVYSIAFYWLAISIAIARLPGLATGWHLLFYALTTVIWFIPAAALVWWIQAPQRR
jgi:hypothetical protein